MKVYVEGGGDSNALRTECRRGFREFLEKAGLKGNMPSIIASGGRQSAYNDYCTAIANGETAMLLIDSEAPVDANHQPDGPNGCQPWQHLKARGGDGWDKPHHANDSECHLMVEVMESWFLADRKTLKSFFDPGFRENQLPAATNSIESLAKLDVYRALENATAHCKTKAPYGKGAHSFKLLAKIDPAMVTTASPWAKRFVDTLKEKMSA